MYKWVGLGAVVSAAIIILVGSAGNGGVADAQVDVQVSAEKQSVIQSKCSLIKTNLNRLHTTDALMRVNRGQIYASLSSELMARLNSRIALNRMDAANLVRITSRYETHHEEFRKAYQVYSDSLLQLMRIDCEEEPVEFYQNLVEVRQYRKQVHETVSRLNDDITAYEDAFMAFRRSYATQNGGQGE